MKLAHLFFILAVFTMGGCSSIGRFAGATFEIRGVVHNSADKSPVANIPVEIRGTHMTFVMLLVPMASFRPLKTVTTDAQGRFSCIVPLYTGYRFYAGDFDAKRGDRIIDRKQIKNGGEVEILVGPPFFVPDKPNQTTDRSDPRGEGTAPPTANSKN